MKGKVKIDERRRCVRAKRTLTIEHRLFKRRGVLIDGRWNFSVTENMSLVGILFRSDTLYKAGDILQVRVVMTGLDVFRGFARVVRIEERKSGLPYAVGVTFVDEKSKLVEDKSEGKRS